MMEFHRFDLMREQEAIRDVRCWKWKRENKEKITEPTDEDLNWPEPMVSVQWDTGYCILTLEAYNKLKAKEKRLFNKLGGLK